MIELDIVHKDGRLETILDNPKTEPGLQLMEEVKPKWRILILSQWYPLAMASYWRNAFLRRPDVDLKICGPSTGNWIPWAGGMNLLPKYAVTPDYYYGGVEKLNQLVPYSAIEYQMGDWKPDLIVAVDAMCNWTGRPNVGCPVVTIGTDSHCLDYDHARSISDKFFNMHKHYMKHGDINLPYAFDPDVHYKIEGAEKKFDAGCVGMGYKHRTDLMNALRSAGLSVYYENGPVFDEYREVQNQCKIGVNYSSELDMNARVFELMAMGVCPLINKVPDLDEFFTEGVDYVGFTSIEEAVYKAQKLIETPAAIESIARQAYDAVWGFSEDLYPAHSYDQRVQDLMKIMGMV